MSVRYIMTHICYYVVIYILVPESPLVGTQVNMIAEKVFNMFSNSVTVTNASELDNYFLESRIDRIYARIKLDIAKPSQNTSISLD